MIWPLSPCMIIIVLYLLHLSLSYLYPILRLYPPLYPTLQSFSLNTSSAPFSTHPSCNLCLERWNVDKQHQLSRLTWKSQMAGVSSRDNMALFLMAC